MNPPEVLLGQYHLQEFLEAGEYHSDWLSSEGQDPVVVRIASKVRCGLFPGALLDTRVPSFPTLVAQGIHGDSCYFVWRAPRGPSLADQYSQQAFSLGEILDWAEQLLQGLAMLSKRGIIHGCLSPQSLILEEGAPMVRDLGLRTGRRLGSCAYCPPEARGEIQHTLGPASDLYSLGLTLLSARLGPPLEGHFGQPREVLGWCGRGVWQPEESHLWNTVASWFGRLIAYDPAWRYSSPKQALNELRRLRDSLPKEPRLERPPSDPTVGNSSRPCWSYRFSSLSLDSPWLATELVGRDSEWMTWRDEVVRAEGGERRALLLEGDYGMGKSRLLKDWGREAQARGWHVLILKSDISSLSTTEAFRRRLAKTWGLHLDDLPDLKVEGEGLVLKSEFDPNKPWVILLDDLNLAQQQARRLVSSWVSQAQASGLIIAATQPEGREKVLVLPWTAMLSLGPLSEDETRLLAENLLGPSGKEQTSACFAFSQGNPTLIECFCCRPDSRETCSPEKSLPDWRSVHYQRCGKLLNARLWALHAAERSLLEAASVLGWMFSLRELVAITDCAESNPDRLLVRSVRWGLLQRRSTGLFDFTHPSLRRALYEGLSEESRRNLHLRALQLTGSVGVRPDHAFFAGDLETCKVAFHALLHCTTEIQSLENLTEILERVAQRAQQIKNYTGEVFQDILCDLAALYLRLGEVPQAWKVVRDIPLPASSAEPARKLYAVVLALAAIQPTLPELQRMLESAVACQKDLGGLEAEFETFFNCLLLHPASTQSALPVQTWFGETPKNPGHREDPLLAQLSRLTELRNLGLLTVTKPNQVSEEQTTLTDLLRLHELAYTCELEAFLQLHAELTQVPVGPLERLLMRDVRLIGAGLMLQRGQSDQGRQRTQELLHQARSAGDHEGQSWAGTLMILSGMTQPCSTESLPEESDSTQGVWSLTELGLNSLSRGHLGQACTYLNRALERARADKLAFFGLTACCYLITALRLQLASAPLENRPVRRHLQEQLDAVLLVASEMELGFPQVSCHLNRERAWIAFFEGQPKEAEERLKSSLAQAVEFGLTHEESWTLYAKGFIGRSLSWPESEEIYFRSLQNLAEQDYFFPELTPGFETAETLTVSQMENSMNWGSKLLEESDLEELESTLLEAARNLIKAQTYTLVGSNAEALRGDRPPGLDQRLLKQVFDSVGPLHFSALQGCRELMLEPVTAALAVRCGPDRALWICSSRGLQPFPASASLLLEGLSKFFEASFSSLAKVQQLEVLRHDAQIDQQSFRNLFQKAGVPLALTDADRQILVVNQAFRQCFQGRVPNDLGEILHLEDRFFSDTRPGESATRLVRYFDGSSARWGLLSQVALSNSEILFSLTDRSLEYFDQVFELFEQERHFVACELHDAVSAPLAALYFAWLSREPEGGDQQQLEEILDRARNLNLLPSFWVTTGSTKRLVGEWRRRCESAGLEFISEEAVVSLSPLQSATIERVVGEALTNIIRHARAGRVRFKLWDRETEFGVEVSDDGCGFEIDSAGQRFGLSTMRSRAQRAGARFEVKSTPGEGTRIRLVFTRDTGPR